MSLLLVMYYRSLIGYVSCVWNHHHAYIHLQRAYVYFYPYDHGVHRRYNHKGYLGFRYLYSYKMIYLRVRYNSLLVCWNYKFSILHITPVLFQYEAAVQPEVQQSRQISFFVPPGSTSLEIIGNTYIHLEYLNIVLYSWILVK